jgi:hypothetical protein
LGSVDCGVVASTVYGRQLPATFGGLRGIGGVKTFLKVLLVLAVAILVVKLLPVALGVGFGLGAVLLAAAAVGLSVVTAIVCALLGLAALFSPVWIPVLAIIGVISLIKRTNRNGNGNGATA